MTTIADLEPGLLHRLEEVESDCRFWDIPNELRPLLIEAMCEAVLLTGEPETRTSQLVSLAANTTLFSIPSDAVAIVRLESSYASVIRRTSIWDLDQQYPGWHNEPAGPRVKYWFPFGLTGFGVYPQLQAPVNVFLTYIQLPVTVDPPYDGMQDVPFLPEYLDGFEEYGAHAARLKEGGVEFAESMPQYDSFLRKMQELSRLVLKKSPLRFTRRAGMNSSAATGQ